MKAIDAETPTQSEPLLRATMPELDAIRGLAILAVLVYHAMYWQVNVAAFPRLERLLLTAAWTGRLGVNLFFVLSGFLITGLLLDSKGKVSLIYWTSTVP